MSMHLHHPSLSLNGKRKGKVKFRNATEAKRARENQDSWNTLLKQHEVAQQEKKQKRAMNAEVWKPAPVTYRGSELPRIPSLETTWEPCTKALDKVYTGDKMLGIVVQHKSCLQPVFSKEAAEDSAKMRR